MTIRQTEPYKQQGAKSIFMLVGFSAKQNAGIASRPILPRASELAKALIDYISESNSYPKFQNDRPVQIPQQPPVCPRARGKTSLTQYL